MEKTLENHPVDPTENAENVKTNEKIFLPFFPFFFSGAADEVCFFEEQRAPRERAPSSELRLEGKGVKRSRETVVPFC